MTPGGPPTGAPETAGDREITNVDGRPSAEGDFLQFVAGGESNPSAIGGKEGVFSTLGAGDGDGLGFGKRPAVQHRASERAVGLRPQTRWWRHRERSQRRCGWAGRRKWFGPSLSAGARSMLKLTRRVADGGVSRKCRSAGTPSAIIPTTATANAAIHACRPCVDAVAVAVVCGATVSNAPSSANDTSPISRTRCLRSFCRHRRITVTTAAGTVAGSAVQSGSFIRMRASVSETSSPSNARLAVSIS